MHSDFKYALNSAGLVVNAMTAYAGHYQCLVCQQSLTLVLAPTPHFEHLSPSACDPRDVRLRAAEQLLGGDIRRDLAETQGVTIYLPCSGASGPCPMHEVEALTWPAFAPLEIRFSLNDLGVRGVFLHEREGGRLSLGLALHHRDARPKARTLPQHCFEVCADDVLEFKPLTLPSTLSYICPDCRQRERSQDGHDPLIAVRNTWEHIRHSARVLEVVRRRASDPNRVLN